MAVGAGAACYGSSEEGAIHSVRGEPEEGTEARGDLI